MKHLLFICLSFLLSINIVNAQTSADSTGLLGDHFSLQGALDVFKNAKDLEAFEKELNKEDKSINNLDLNEDSKVDYIRVVDHYEGDVHAIVLQAVLAEEESQDIAVIAIEKTGEESSTLQIIGDELLYGDSLYVEPFEEVGEADEDGGPASEYRLSRIVVNVWLWPSVRFIYRPNYVVYHSPYRWGYYPSYWRPWSPVRWNVYHANRYHYHHHYRPVRTHRVVHAHNVYTPKRRTSARVTTKSRTVTKVRRNANGNVIGKKQHQTTKVRKNANGNTKVKKTKTKQKGVKKKGKNGNVKSGKMKKTTVKKTKKKKGGN